MKLGTEERSVGKTYVSTARPVGKTYVSTARPG